MLAKHKNYEYLKSESKTSPLKISLNNGKTLLLYAEEFVHCKSGTVDCDRIPSHHPQLTSKERLDSNEEVYYYAEKAEIFDPANKTLKVIDAPHFKGHRTITKLKNGKVLLTGGMELPLSLRWLSPLSNCDFPSAAEIFDPSTNQFQKTGCLKIARENHTTTLLKNGKVLITGGTDCSSCDSLTAMCVGTAATELYIPET